MSDTPVRQDGTDRLTFVINQLQETAKWLTGIFITIGSAIIAVAQLSGVGNLQFGSNRFWIGVVCGLITFVCLGIILALRHF